MPPDARPRRVLLLDLPRLLADLIGAAIDGQSDLEIVGGAGTDGIADVLAAEPDFVIVAGARGGLPHACRALFDSRPHLKILALAGDAEHGEIWELAPRRMQIGELSPEGVVAAIRATTAWRWDG